MIISEILDKRFWADWVQTFMSDANRYVNPNDPLVRDFASQININEDDTTLDRAVKAWLFVEEKIDYKLTLRWKTPAETINEMKGDCEDMTFLLASIFPLLNIKESQIGIGRLHLNNDRVEEHSWNIVNGNIIDATGSPEEVEDLKYEQTATINIVDVNKNPVMLTQEND